MSKRFCIKILAVVLVVVGFSAAFSVTLSERTSAASSSVTTKYKMERVWKCLNDGAYAKSWKASNLKLINSGFVRNNYSDPFKHTSGVPVSGGMSCYEVMFDGPNGMLSDKIKTIDTALDSSGDEIAKEFKKIGYDAKKQGVELEGNEQQLTYTVTEYQGKPQSSSKTEIVFPAVGIVNGGLSVEQGTGNVSEPGSTGSKDFEVTFSGNKFKISVIEEGSVDYPKWRIVGDDGNAHTVVVDNENGEAKYSFKEKIGVAKYGEPGQNITLEGKTKTVKGKSENHSVEYYMYWQGNPNNMLKGLNSSFPDYDSLALTKQEVYTLYRDYVKNVLKAKVVCEGESEYENYSDVSTYINWNTCGKCKIDKNTAEDLYVLGVDSNYHLNKEVKLDDIITTLSAMNIEGLEGADQCTGDTPVNPEEPGTTSEFDCDQLIDQNTDGEGIGAMQWVLCPSLNNTSYTADWLDKVTQGLLEVDPDMYGKEDFKKVWGSVRDMANVTIVVFLLIVIFSQVTGRGIDNYGIKKMLPRIIMMAIVVNLSLYICRIAIDLSNIAGVGLRNMFGTMAGSTTNNSSYLISALLGIFAAAPTVGGAVITGLAFGGWVAVVIGLVVLVIVIIVALVTLFAMLGAREIIIIFCVIISPLAFASFILPNTQSLFKKWFDLFKAAIIVFPLCGAASGISATMRKLAEDGTLDGLGVGGKLVMLVLPYLIFFLLPMLLKQSIAGLGKLGGALSSMGNTIKNGARSIGQNGARGVQNSERFKNWSNFRQQEAAARRARRTYDSLHGRAGLNARQRDRLRRAQDVLAEHDKRRTEDFLQTEGDYMQGQIAKQRLAASDQVEDMTIYNDATYIAGKQAQSRVSRDSERGNAAMYADQAYESGKLISQDLARSNEAASTVLYNNAEYVKGKRALTGLGISNDEATATMYGRNDALVNSKAEQFNTQRYGEIRKMHAEQLANSNATEKQERFRIALQGNDRAAIEEMDAAFDSLMATGDLTEIFDVIANKQIVNKNMNQDMVNRLVQKLGSSGDVIMKGFAKDLANANGPRTFEEFAADTSSDRGLEHYLSDEAGEHALDTAKKETLEFMSGVKSADNHNYMADMHGEAINKIIANASTTAANQNQRAAKAVATMIGTDEGRKTSIGQHVAAKGLTSMNETVAAAYGPTALAPAVTEIRKAGNEQLLAGVSEPIRNQLGLTVTNYNDENGGD